MSQLGAKVNGYTVIAVSETPADPGIVTILARTRLARVTGEDDGVQYVVSHMRKGAREWFQGHYSHDYPSAVRDYLAISSFDDVARSEEWERTV